MSCELTEAWRSGGGRCGVVTALLLAFSVICSQSVFAEDRNKHHDAFMSGDPGETRIARAVRHELLMLPYYGVFDDLAFNVEGDTVTLEGAVVKPVLKTDAERAMQHIEGVERVVNNIQVLPPSPLDD